jgi:hypothetical protein
MLPRNAVCGAWRAPGLRGVSRVIAGALLVGGLTAPLTSCGKKGEVIVKTADGRRLRAEDVDRDPLALLPSGALGIMAVDARALYASEFGQKSFALTQRWLPVPADAGFDPRRDLERLVFGLYTMQGADVAGVAIGTFDVESIERAAAATTTAAGLPVVKSTYAGRTLFTANDLGFTVLTQRTALFGNEAGIRRALDRLEEGRVKRDIPAWATDLLQRPEAPLAAAFDLRESPVTDALRQDAAFVAGLERVRLVGNFQPPGVNVAGTATYTDAAAAAAGAQNLAQLESTLRTWGWFASLLGMAQPLRGLQVRATNAQLELVAGLDAQALAVLLDRLIALSAAGARVAR